MNETGTPEQRDSAIRSLTIIGLGNIGSHLPPLLARSPALEQITLIDHDRYEQKNLYSQDIASSEVGKRKVDVQARRLRRINPALRVRALAARVEDVPLGLLRAAAILAALDSRISRQYVNEAAWRLGGIPWIDAAVDAANWLVRVNVYVPGPDAPCLECAWDENDYAALEQRYPCQQGVSSPPTNAPAVLGAVAAGLMAAECRKLDGQTEHLLAGRQVMVDLRHHTHEVTAFRRNPRCRFDHRPWEIERLADSAGTPWVRALLRRAAGESGQTAACSLQVPGHAFARMQFCPACGHHARHAWRLARRVPAAQRRCPDCGAEMVVRGIDMFEQLDDSMLRGPQRRASLVSLGIQPGDVLCVGGPAGEWFWEVGEGGRRRKQPGRPVACAVGSA